MTLMKLDDRGKWVTECDHNQEYKPWKLVFWIKIWVTWVKLDDQMGWGDWVKPPHSEVASLDMGNWTFF